MVDSGRRYRPVAAVDDAASESCRCRRSIAANRSGRRMGYLSALAHRPGNVVVFVPLGMALAFGLGPRLARWRLLIATLIGAALSLTIELAQAGIPSRVAAVGDFLLNTVGTAAGALVACWLRDRATPAV